ncbi:MAG: hypothetical protein HY821_01210 [Acidobacteria bacterium]|nr:hypothetical protein [Acidobacteriota bacterium]
MRLALHIFLNDARRFRVEIVFSLVVTLAMGWLNGNPPQEANTKGHLAAAAILQALAVVSWCYLVVRVVQSHAFCKTDEDWLTRPVPLPALLVAKALFVLVFLVLPANAAVWIWLSSLGLHPERHLADWLFYAAAFSSLVAVPCALAAAITPNLPAAILTLFGAVLAVSLGDETLPRFVDSWSVLVWVPLAAFHLALLAGCAVGLWLQMVRRRTRAARVAALLTLAGCIGVQCLLKFEPAFDLQRALVTGGQNAGAERVEVKAKLLAQPAGAVGTRPGGGQWLDLRLEGIPAELRVRMLQMEAYAITAQGRRGLAQSKGGRASQEGHMLFPIQRGLGPAALEGVVYYELLEPQGRREFPFVGEERFAVDGGWCRLVQPQEFGGVFVPVFICSWPFRAPAELTLAYRGSAGESESRLLSGTEAGSPFPAQVGGPVRSAVASFRELDLGRQSEAGSRAGAWIISSWKINGFHRKQFRIEASAIER